MPDFRIIMLNFWLKMSGVRIIMFGIRIIMSDFTTVNYVLVKDV